MVAAVSPNENDSSPAAAEPTHWLNGRYFVCLPDLSDETRRAIYAAGASALWIEITTRLRDLERRGKEPAERQAAFTGRLEALGVKGLAAAIGCSPTTVLKHLRSLEALGLIRTEQGAFVNEADPVTGKIRRNYAKAPPKVIVVTIQDRHCRPSRASQTRQPRQEAPPPKTDPKNPEPRANSCRVSKEPNLQRGSVPLEPNRRRTAAGPFGRPAAAAAKAGQKQSAAPPDPKASWQEQADEEALERARKAMVEHFAAGLNMHPLEVIALWKAQPDELKRQAVEAGLLTPEGKIIRASTRIRRFAADGQPLQRDQAAAEKAVA